jgi:hypothetical protein
MNSQNKTRNTENHKVVGFAVFTTVTTMNAVVEVVAPCRSTQTTAFFDHIVVYAAPLQDLKDLKLP